MADDHEEAAELLDALLPEVVRVLNALAMSATCPAGWKPGDATIEVPVG